MPSPRLNARTVVVIPARGGSKGLPGKNLRPVGGRPLVARAVLACRATPGIDEVCVSTDDDAIAAVAEAAGARVIRRPAELAGDLAGSESVLLHALDTLADPGRPVGTLVFVQCTSPFIRPADLQRAVQTLARGEADCAFSAAASHAFLWRRVEGTQLVAGQNHDAAVRPRRQDREPDHRETGAFYVLDAAGFRRARHRFFGRVTAVEVPELGSVEIDTADDLRLAEALAPLLDPAGPPGRDRLDVDMVITDFDGVHTDDSVAVDQHGVETVQVSRSDGFGITRLRAAGVPLVIVSTERNPVVGARAAKLGVEVLQGVGDKRAALDGLVVARGLDPARVAYLGNDVNDLPAMVAVGWPVAVPDAHPQVLRRARVVLTRRGGHGAVRELCELVIAGRDG